MQEAVVVGIRAFILRAARILWSIKEEALFFKHIRKIGVRPYQTYWVETNKISMSACKADSQCTYQLKDRFIQGGDWDLELVNPLNHPIVQTAFDVSRGEIDWRDSGEYARMERLIKLYGHFDNCNSSRDVEDRYNTLEKIVDEVRYTRRMKSKKDSHFLNFRELGGIEAAIGRDGQIIKVGDGQHRLGIALALGVNEIPVSIVLVHQKYGE